MSSSNSNGATSRSWPFTWFPPNGVLPEDPQALADEILRNKKTKFIVFQLEKCPTTDRMHYQGFFQVLGKGGVRKRAALALLEPHMPQVSLNPMYRKATPLDNVGYCTKEETRVDGPWYAGDYPSGQGKRTDLDTFVREYIASGFSNKRALDSAPGLFLRFGAHLKRVKEAYYEPPRDFDYRAKPRVVVLYGPTGTGKSFRANLLFPEAYRWTDPDGKALYAYNYRGQSDHILEDFTGWAKYRWLLTFLDRGIIHVNTCGSGSECPRSNIVITSDRPPIDWYPNLFQSDQEGNMYKQLRRRIDLVVHLPMALSEASAELLERSVIAEQYGFKN